LNAIKAALTLSKGEKEILINNSKEEMAKVAVKNLRNLFKTKKTIN